MRQIAETDAAQAEAAEIAARPPAAAAAVMSPDRSTSAGRCAFAIIDFFAIRWCSYPSALAEGHAQLT